MGVGRDNIENVLAWHRRWGELAIPTAEMAMARIMQQELEQCLTPLAGQVLELRLQHYSESEIATSGAS